ncbi:MAG: hypothetical protein EXS40_00430 [Opitutaceae bacterium]|nr:hypothetical protein [Opitutaceae bacterium]
MSAKKPKATKTPAQPSISTAPLPTPSPASSEVAAPPPSWLDSPDPRQRLSEKTILIAVALYVAALCLLALDQTFHLGLFGPKTPPVL